ncbi:MAG: Hsp20 family protein [Candidatus Acidiferrales bacterium]|jgi:HSP20 family protein
MNPQAATAMQPAKGPVAVKQSATSDVPDQIQQTYDSIARRAFEIFNDNGRWLGHELENWFRAESELLHPVHLEIAESDDSLTVRAEVPGFSTKELEIHVEPRKLTIAGKHEAQEESKKGKRVYSESCAKEILRVVDLPTEVDSSKVSAILKDGILNVELPKATHAKTVRVEARTER